MRGFTPAIDRVLPRLEVGDCWVFLGAKRNGYGVVGDRGKVAGTHRVVWEALVGPIPEGLQIDHLCRNRACCNPDHLEPVTNRVNSLRGATGDTHQHKKTHCKHGHPFSEENTYHNPAGHRACRTCLRKAALAYWTKERNSA